jgi:hypothetical protein
MKRKALISNWRWAPTPRGSNERGRVRRRSPKALRVPCPIDEATTLSLARLCSDDVFALSTHSGPLRPGVRPPRLRLAVTTDIIGHFRRLSSGMVPRSRTGAANVTSPKNHTPSRLEPRHNPHGLRYRFQDRRRLRLHAIKRIRRRRRGHPRVQSARALSCVRRRGHRRPPARPSVCERNDRRSLLSVQKLRRDRAARSRLFRCHSLPCPANRQTALPLLTILFAKGIQARSLAGARARHRVNHLLTQKRWTLR